MICTRKCTHRRSQLENDDVEAQRQMEKNIAFKRAEMVKACHKMRVAQKECIQKALEIESSAASVSSSEASDDKARTNAMKDVVASAADEARRTLRICLEKSGSDVEGKKACYVAAREELSSRSGQDNGDVSTARADADLEVATAKHNAERLRNCIKRRASRM